MKANVEIRAVLWDFGGVILSSPFVAFNRYEAERGLPRDFIRGVNARNPHGNAWARLERGEIGVADFAALFADESEAMGHRIDGHDILRLISGEVQPEMVEALRRVGKRYKTACLTNNMPAGSGLAMARSPALAAAVEEITKLFDVVVESSKVGIRKPEHRFYQIACELLDIQPTEAVFLDDLGINLKPARDMGMKTIKVAGPDQAIADLEAVLGHSLAD